MKDKKTVQIQRKILSNNLKKLLNAKGKTQTDMARDLQLSETTVSSWINCERYPRLDKIQMMADYFGVYRSAITDEENNNTTRETSSTYNYLPRDVSAGLPNLVDPVLYEEVESITLSDSIMGKWAGDKNIFVMKVNGESMNKIIPHGSLVAIKPSPLESLKDGDIIVYSHNNEFSMKKIYRDNGNVIFRPNSNDNRFFDYVVSTEDSNLLIHGKVVTYIVNLD